MKKGIYTITENINLAAGIWKMVLAGDGTAVTAPGQFIDIKLDGRYLRRPISVHDADEGSITIIYKVLGHGTLTKNLTVKAAAFSESAKAKIEEAGGKAEVV